jgi:hypothetical protein
VEAWRLGGLGGAKVQTLPTRSCGHGQHLVGGAVILRSLMSLVLPLRLIRSSGARCRITCESIPHRTPDRGAPIRRVTLSSPQSSRRRIRSGGTRWCTSRPSSPASRTRLVCSTKPVCAHHQPNRCTSPTGRQDLPPGRLCIAEPLAGFAAATGVHHRTDRGASPTGARASPNRSVHIAGGDRVHHRTGAQSHKPGWCASPPPKVYIRIAACAFDRRASVTAIESMACTAHSGSAIVMGSVTATRGATDRQSGYP